MFRVELLNWCSGVPAERCIEVIDEEQRFVEGIRIPWQGQGGMGKVVQGSV